MLPSTRIANRQSLTLNSQYDNQKKEFRIHSLNRIPPTLLVDRWQTKDSLPTLNSQMMRFLPKLEEG
jgi:hypothetical protein